MCRKWNVLSEKKKNKLILNLVTYYLHISIEIKLLGESSAFIIFKVDNVSQKHCRDFALEKPGKERLGWYVCNSFRPISNCKFSVGNCYTGTAVKHFLLFLCPEFKFQLVLTKFSEDSMLTSHNAAFFATLFTVTSLIKLHCDRSSLMKSQTLKLSFERNY